MKRRVIETLVAFLILLSSALTSMLLFENLNLLLKLLFGIEENLNLLLKFLIFSITLFVILLLFSIFLSKRLLECITHVIILTACIACLDLFKFHISFLFVLIPLFIYSISNLVVYFIKFKGFNELNPMEEYVNYKYKHGKLINVGISLLNVVCSYLLLLPIVSYFDTIVTESFTNNFNVSSIISILIILIGSIMNTVSVFTKLTSKKEYTKRGIYLYARYPDIFGEVIFFVGIYLLLISLNSTMWVLFLCPIAYLLFKVLVFIPIKEKSLQNDEEYLEYKKQTNMFIFKK